MRGAMRNFSFACDVRETRELRRAAKRNGLAIATVARVMTLMVFGVRPTERVATGPRNEETAAWLARRAKGRAKGVR